MLFNSFCKLYTCLLIHTLSCNTLLRKYHGNSQTEFWYFNDGNPLRLVDICRYFFLFFAYLIEFGNCRVRFIWRLKDSILKMLKQKITERWRLQDNVKLIKYKRFKIYKIKLYFWHKTRGIRWKLKKIHYNVYLYSYFVNWLLVWQFKKNKVYNKYIFGFWVNVFPA